LSDIIQRRKFQDFGFSDPLLALSFKHLPQGNLRIFENTSISSYKLPGYTPIAEGTHAPMALYRADATRRSQPYKGLP